jgi:hypothetical protein
MYNATCSVLKNIIDDGSTYTQRGDADSAYDTIISFEFVFNLHLIKEILRVTNDLCQALQLKSQDILNAMHLVSTTKAIIQELRESGWNKLLDKVLLFCKEHDIHIPDMDARYTAGRGRVRHQQYPITMEHHYRVDVFTAVVDSQLQELNRRFNERTMQLLILSSALDPMNGYMSFKIDDICYLVNQFYPQDFNNQEKIHLKFQLQHYERDVPHHPYLKEMKTIDELCNGLVETGKSDIYHLIYRLICLILTLPVSTATTERAFSAIKIVKTALPNKMEDEFLIRRFILYIKKYNIIINKSKDKTSQTQTHK